VFIDTTGITGGVGVGVGEVVNDPQPEVRGIGRRLMFLIFPSVP